MDYKMVLLLLINGSIYNKKVGLMEEIWSDIDWRYIKEEAKQHNCTGIVFPSIKRVQEKYNCIDKELFAEWLNEVEKLKKQCESYRASTQNILNKLKDNNIDVALLKGAVLDELYSKNKYRDSYDIDLLMDKEEKDKAIDVLKSLGYEQVSNSNKLVQKSEGIIIDIHDSLIDENIYRDFKDIEGLDFNKKDLFFELEGKKITCKTLDATSTYQYLFLHMVKHFKENGIGLRHLMDVTLFYKKYEKEIDVIKVEETMKKLGYMEFYRAICSLCIVHFGMHKTSLPCEYIMESYVYKKLLDDVFDSGTFGEKTLRRIKLVRMKEKLDNKILVNRLKKKFFKLVKIADDNTKNNVEDNRKDLIGLLGL